VPQVKRLVAAAALAATLAAGLTTAGARTRLDYAEVAFNVLPPGQNGSIVVNGHSTDQIPLYDGLTPLQGNVRAADVRRYFKSARFGAEGRIVRTERPRPGVRILRDRWDVPHVYGRTRADVMFGAGWATAADRGLLLQLLRNAGRIAAVDVPGLDAFSFALSGREYVPSPQVEAVLRAQVDRARRAGPRGRELYRDVVAYVAGINAYNRARSLPIDPWTPVDVAGMGALIGAVFGAGGGDETRRAMFLDALRERLGPERGQVVWNDLRDRLDPEAPVTVARRFPWEAADAGGAGNRLVADGSFEPVRFGVAQSARRHPRRMSNALLVGGSRSASGRPIFVAGPQVGQYYPQILMELDLHGGGIDARGATFPGISFYVLLGRGRDFAWSLTSSSSDLIDDYAETLCGDERHYVYRGTCREMETFDAGVLKGRGGEPDRRLVFRTTVHGPVVGYAISRGVRVAIARKRSTRGRELLSALAWQDLNTNRIRGARSFLRAASKLELSFNWFYADDRDVATYSTGRLPLRASGVDPGLPTDGSGSFEWRGFLPFAGHPQAIDPPSGLLVNWNNKPAPGFTASDDNWSHGSVQRVELLQRGLARRRRHTPATVVAAMNRAATQDLREVEVVPVIAEVLRGGPAPTARAQQMLELLLRWNANGSSRLDRELDGHIDSAGAAVLDAAWPRIADAVMRPVLGPLVERLAQLNPRDDAPGPNANGYGGGWYGYVEKDLRTLLGRPVRGPYATRFCGAGDLAACRASLWAALDEAGAELARAQGPDPAAWRSDARDERIVFAGGLLPRTMRFANRPTFQQVMTFDGHRGR
jgi:acyl-homoserine lactone acylase PvdQ